MTPDSTNSAPQTDAQAANASSSKTQPQKQQRPFKRSSSRPFVALLAVAVAVLAGYGGASLQSALEDQSAGTTILKTAAEDGNMVTTPSEESIAAVASAVSPSVVSIVTSTTQTSRLNNGQYAVEGAGTGMIVSENGYIMTNKHVVEGASQVSVVLPDGRTFENVQVLGSDPLNDVAFLKIRDVTDLPAITLGDSKTVRIGQTVIAIGNALGQYQNSVTSGIISGTGRPVLAASGQPGSNPDSLTDLIQTDAAINSGNSGGPLLNLKGQVIGINTAVAEDAQSIGFAIPISATKGLLNYVIKTGSVERAYLGVQYVSITPAVKREYDLPVNTGDYVTAERGNSVQPNGPADKAGIEDGDIIIAVNGFKVGQVASVASLVSEYQPGDTVEITVLRDGRERTLRATLGTYEA